MIAEFNNREQNEALVARMKAAGLIGERAATAAPVRLPVNIRKKIGDWGNFSATVRQAIDALPEEFDSRELFLKAESLNPKDRSASSIHNYISAVLREELAAGRVIYVGKAEDKLYKPRVFRKVKL